MKIKTIHKTILIPAAFMWLAGICQSCTDDNFIIEGDPDGEEAVYDGSVLSLTFEVEKDPYTRASDSDGKGKAWNVGMDSDGLHPEAEDKEDFVDTQDKLRVFFFTEKGDFIFGAIDRTISHGTSVDGRSNTYTVRIPMNVLVDRQGNEYPVERIKDYLRNNSFKVAVLANWPNADAKINPGDYDDGDNSQNFGENPSSSLKGHPLWGYRNSILYDPDNNEDDKALESKIGEKALKNINDLHHLFDEINDYASETRTTSRPYSNKDCYEPFMGYNDDGVLAMGEPTDWVKMRNVEAGWHASYNMKDVYSFDSKETANQWIRCNWTPDVQTNLDKKIYRHYQHLWYLWNFDASYKYSLYLQNPTTNGRYSTAYQSNFGWNNGFTAGIVNSWGKEWYARNGKSFYEWMHGTDSKNTLESITIISGNKTGESDSGSDKPEGTASSVGMNDSFFTFNKFLNGEECYMVTNSSANNPYGANYYGIRLPSRGNSMAGNETPGTFVFQARTAGTLRIKWGNGSNSRPATICVQKGKEWQEPYTIAAGNRYKIYDLGGTNSGDTFYDITMEGESVPIYIYCSEGTAVIYAIEYIRGKYLYETDREGVIPSEDQPIPMYGVQDYPALEDWADGSTQDITSMPGGSPVKLLRSLAKVEVFIPVSFGRPRHIYMRNMNRAARCEPMDVEHPIVWDERDTGHDPDCEFFNLIKYKPVYQAKTENGSANYRNWLSWFYGSWKNASWGENYKGWDFSSVNMPLAGDHGYPKIFNPYITRSDFCHFIYMGEDGTNHRYVLYLPEKYIDDLKYPGVFDSSPMVPHIEYRFDPATTVDDKGSSLTHSEFNLDDDRCFRIYFTNYGNAEGAGEYNPEIGSVSGSSYGTYEKDKDNLSKHWPILRNHTYSFHVAGSSPDRVKISVLISDWKHEKVVTVW